jgi:hypothetical protein
MISVLHSLARILSNPKSAIQCLLFDSKQIDYRTGKRTLRSLGQFVTIQSATRLTCD